MLLSLCQIDLHHVRLLAQLIEDDFAAVCGYIEVVDREAGIEIGELALLAGVEVRQPEVAIACVALEDDKAVAAWQEDEGTGCGSRARPRIRRSGCRRRRTRTSSRPTYCTACSEV
jgi:hypothetical protein